MQAIDCLFFWLIALAQPTHILTSFIEFSHLAAMHNDATGRHNDALNG